MSDPRFPNITNRNHTVTSPQTPRYNCIAWAANEFTRWWWPMPGYYWPREAPRECTVDAFVAAYGTVGYSWADHGRVEQGFDKIAIYVDGSNTPTHAARLLPNGKWTSKLGAGFDIEHDAVETVEGPLYGRVFCYLKRPHRADEASSSALQGLK